MNKKPASSKTTKKAKSRSEDHRFKSHLKLTRRDARRARKLRPECKEMKNKNQTPGEGNPDPKNILDTALQDIQSQLVTLPPALRKKVEELATSTLSRVLTIEHMTERIRIMTDKSDFFPGSTQFEFRLTCKSEFKDSKEFAALSKESGEIVTDMKQSLRAIIHKVQRMELDGFKHIIVKEFAKQLTEILKTAVYHLRKSSFNKADIREDRKLPYSDEEAGKQLTRAFFTLFCNSKQGEDFPQLFSSSIEMILKKMKPEWLNLKTLGSERAERTQHDALVEEVGNNIFPIIKKVTVDVRNKFFEKRKIQEADRLTKEMLKNKEKRQITAEVDTALGKEPILPPKTLLDLIDDRISCKVQKNLQVAPKTPVGATKTARGVESSPPRKKQKNGSHGKQKTLLKGKSVHWKSLEEGVRPGNDKKKQKGKQEKEKGTEVVRTRNEKEGSSENSSSNHEQEQTSNKPEPGQPISCTQSGLASHPMSYNHMLQEQMRLSHLHQQKMWAMTLQTLPLSYPPSTQPYQNTWQSQIDSPTIPSGLPPPHPTAYHTNSVWTTNKQLFQEMQQHQNKELTTEGPVDVGNDAGKKRKRDKLQA